MADIQFFASETHYQDHQQPIIDALPDTVSVHKATKSIDLLPAVPTVVSSYGNCKTATKKGLPIIMTEHGCGLTYNVDHPSYAGGTGRENVILFLNTNEFVDHANRARYPKVGHVIIGSPRVDLLTKIVGPPADAAKKVVAFSWHWECRVAPETRSAFPHYRRDLGRAMRARREWQPLGHAHPRAWPIVNPSYKAWRWQTTKTFETVVASAHVYVCDNSSTIFEWAALDRTVIVANSPHYRRHITHGYGLRFWDLIPGIQVDRCGELPTAISQAISKDVFADERRRISDLVYPYRGEAANRAVTAILNVL